MATIKRASIAGEPSAAQPRRPFLRFRRPVLRRRSVTRLQKVDEARGVTMPEHLNLTDTHGLATPGAGGFKGATQIRQKPNAPGPTSAGVTTVKAPSPAGKGRIGRRVR